ncbi:MAG: hypothetical protein MZW92_71735 [Comamonadaceae bacterium]|nr:hypothetical protein [Comamonadaceae bacterium]
MALSDADLDHVVAITRAHSHFRARDVAMLYVLFATGAKPLEVARLEVGDYLDGGLTQQRLGRTPSECFNAALPGRVTGARPLRRRSARRESAPRRRRSQAGTRRRAGGATIRRQRASPPAGPGRWPDRECAAAVPQFEEDSLRR